VIAVTGATGTIGGELVRLLSVRGGPVRALSRDPHRGEELDGVEWVTADLAERDTRDVAAVAAAALTESGHEGERYVLTGPEALSYHQVTEILSDALGRRVVHVEETDDEAWARLRRAGLPPWLAAGQIALYGYQRAGGPTAEVSDAVERLTGRPARGLEEFARDHAHLFT
jgi:uncharacterized protein YbjT (DUF2867 family)